MTSTRYSRIQARVTPTERPSDEVVEEVLEIAQKAGDASFVASVKRSDGRTEMVFIPAKVVRQLALEVQGARRALKSEMVEARERG
jgi:hypothetical protein